MGLMLHETYRLPLPLVSIYMSMLNVVGCNFDGGTLIHENCEN